MISEQLALAFIAFAAATLFTPGPNNIMLMASGLNYGFRRTLPHIAGVTLGFSFRPWTASKAIADGPSILNYLEEAARDYGIDEHIRYSTRVTGASWSTRPSEGLSHARRLPLKPRSRSCAARTARCAEDCAPSTTAISRLSLRVAVATRLKPEAQMKPVFMPSAPG